MVEREPAIVYELSYGGGGKNSSKPMGFDNAVSGIQQAMGEGETPRVALWGKFENGKYGLLVATDSRLVGFNRSMFGKVDVHEVPYNMIRAVSFKTGWVFGEVTISTFPSGYRHMRDLNNEAVRTFAGWVSARIGGTGDIGMGRGEHTTTASLSVQSRSVADELAKLAAMRDSGVLTEDEFLEAKKRILK